MVPLTPLSTIDTWREESRAQLAQRGADIKGAEAQRARRQGIKEKARGRTGESEGPLYHNYLQNNFQAMGKDRRWSKCRTWVRV